MVLASVLLLIFTDQIVLAICLPPLAFSLSLIWRRGPVMDTGTICAALLTATGLAVLAGTQVIYLKDFLSGGDFYRMNTLFKFFSQVWVLWGIAAAIAVPKILARLSTVRGGRLRTQEEFAPSQTVGSLTPAARIWGLAFLFLLCAQSGLSHVGHAGAAGATIPRLAPADRHAQRDGVYGKWRLLLAG